MKPTNSQGTPFRKSNAALLTLALALAPACTKDQATAKQMQTEAETYLKTAHAAEVAYYAKNTDYTDSIEKLGFLPARNNRYLYLLNTDGAALTPGQPSPGDHTIVEVDPALAHGLGTAALIADIPVSLISQVGLKGGCPDSCKFTIIAAGNLDDDPGLDVWSISTAARTVGTQNIPAGVPFHDVDDLAK